MEIVRMDDGDREMLRNAAVMLKRYASDTIAEYGDSEDAAPGVARLAGLVAGLARRPAIATVEVLEEAALLLERIVDYTSFGAPATDEADLRLCRTLAKRLLAAADSEVLV